MKRLFTLLFALILVLPTMAKEPKKNDFSKVYSKKKFYFSGWGEPNKKASNEEQTATLKKWSDAGITDILPESGIERLKEIIDLNSSVGLRIHGWHWMMNVGGSKECRENPEWYSVNALGQNCRDFHPYVAYYNFLSPFSEGARTYIKKGVRKKAQVEGLASVHFDYIRYVDVILGNNLQKKYPYKGGKLKQDRILDDFDFGYHANARKQYKAVFGIDPMDLEDRAENPAWQQFRMNAISSLVNECVEISRRRNSSSRSR